MLTTGPEICHVDRCPHGCSIERKGCEGHAARLLASEHFRARAEALVLEASALGVVLTIEQRPLRPLAMGHYATVVDARYDGTTRKALEARKPKRLPPVIKWGFDPDSSQIEALKQSDSRRLWAALRMGHIVDQSFDGDVVGLARSLREYPLKDADDFWARADLYSLGDFGPKVQGTGDGHTRGAPDMEWWSDLLALWRGELDQFHEIPTPQGPAA